MEQISHERRLPRIRELDRRSNGGIEVVLLWCEATGDILEDVRLAA